MTSFFSNPPSDAQSRLAAQAKGDLAALHGDGRFLQHIGTPEGEFWLVPSDRPVLLGEYEVGRHWIFHARGTTEDGVEYPAKLTRTAAEALEELIDLKLVAPESRMKAVDLLAIHPYALDSSDPEELPLNLRIHQAALFFESKKAFFSGKPDSEASSAEVFSGSLVDASVVEWIFHPELTERLGSEQIQQLCSSMLDESFAVTEHTVFEHVMPAGVGLYINRPIPGWTYHDIARWTSQMSPEPHVAELPPFTEAGSTPCVATQDDWVITASETAPLSISKRRTIFWDGDDHKAPRMVTQQAHLVAPGLSDPFQTHVARLVSAWHSQRLIAIALQAANVVRAAVPDYPGPLLTVKVSLQPAPTRTELTGFDDHHWLVDMLRECASVSEDGIDADYLAELGNIRVEIHIPKNDDTSKQAA